MGRAEKRKKTNALKKRMSDDQFNKLVNNSNRELINQEVKNRTDFFKGLFSECLEESFKKNGISGSKSRMVMDDVEIIMLRKVEEKRGK